MNQPFYHKHLNEHKHADLLLTSCCFTGPYWIHINQLMERLQKKCNWIVNKSRNSLPFRCWCFQKVAKQFGRNVNSSCLWALMTPSWSQICVHCLSLSLSVSLFLIETVNLLYLCCVLYYWDSWEIKRKGHPWRVLHSVIGRINTEALFLIAS